MTRKVYVPNLPTRWDAATRKRVPSIDLNAAADYGELVTMSEGPVNNAHINDTIEHVQRQAESITDGDVILLVGDVVLAAACIAWACDNLGSTQVLRWDKNKRAYDVMEVSL